MISRQINNEKGFSLVEVLIAMAIGIALLATATYTYTKQSDVIRAGNQQTQTRGMTRLILDELVTEIRRAGYGMPPGDSGAGRLAQGITAASAISITYLANTDNIMTEIIADCGVSDGIWFVFTSLTPGALTKGFANQDYISVYDTGSPGTAEFFQGTGLIQVTDTFSAVNTYCSSMPAGTSASLVNTGINLTNDYHPIDDNTAVVVHKIITYTYTYNAGAQTITRTKKDGNRTAETSTIANNVTDMTLSYFDVSGTALVAYNAADRGNTRRINISVTVKDRIEDTVTKTFDTDVTLRNMGT